MTARPHAAYDPRGSEILSDDECFVLLEQAASCGAPGRLAFSRSGAPYIIPVNFSLYDGAVLIRLGPGYAAHHLDGVIATFEVDQADPPAKNGWSVVVTGGVRLLTYEEEARLGRNVPRPLVTSPGVRAFLIQPTSVTGRSLRHETSVGRTGSSGLSAHQRRRN
jgi:hypothetical protein